MKCEGDECESTKIVGRKRCTKHYQQWRKAHAPKCSIDECEEPVQSKDLCPKHYQQQRQAPQAEFLLPGGHWAPVAGYEGLYVVSDLGQVHSFPRSTTRGQLVRQRHDPNGYLMVTLSNEGVRVSHRVHVLVLTAFRGACPPKLEGAHDDGNKDNCTLENLFWKTRSENVRDVIRHGRHIHGSKTHCKWGHAFDKKNTRWTAKNRRVCRRCDNTRRCTRIDCKLLTHDHVSTPWRANYVW
jgi:NUMOD4 motif/HNH endonuclease